MFPFRRAEEVYGACVERCLYNAWGGGLTRRSTRCSSFDRLSSGQTRRRRVNETWPAGSLSLRAFHVLE